MSKMLSYEHLCLSSGCLCLPPSTAHEVSMCALIGVSHRHKLVDVMGVRWSRAAFKERQGAGGLPPQDFWRVHIVYILYMHTFFIQDVCMWLQPALPLQQGCTVSQHKAKLNTVYSEIPSRWSLQIRSNEADQFVILIDFLHVAAFHSCMYHYSQSQNRSSNTCTIATNEHVTGCWDEIAYGGLLPISIRPVLVQFVSTIIQESGRAV